jgi:hypothetical protein
MPGFRGRQTLTVYGGGDVELDTCVACEEGLPPALPRVGLRLIAPAGLERFTWFGRGPHENYIDRKEGAAVGLYSCAVDDVYVPYVMPQEHGNRTGARWAALSDETGRGLLAVGMPLLEVSARHHTDEELARARHTFELRRSPDIVFNLDYRHSGLGNGSCGPGVLPQYQVRPGEFVFGLRLRTFFPDDGAVADLARYVIE